MERTVEQGSPMGMVRYKAQGMLPYILRYDVGLVEITNSKHRIMVTKTLYEAYTCYWMTKEEVDRFLPIFKNLENLRELQQKKDKLLFEMVQCKIMELCKK